MQATYQVTGQNLEVLMEEAHGIAASFCVPAKANIDHWEIDVDARPVNMFSESPPSQWIGEVTCTIYPKDNVTEATR